MLDEFVSKTLKSNKRFTDFTPEERAFMILSNHPIYRAHKEIQQDIDDECAMLEQMTERQREIYFAEIEKTDGEWQIEF